MNHRCNRNVCFPSVFGLSYRLSYRLSYNCLIDCLIIVLCARGRIPAASKSGLGQTARCCPTYSWGRPPAAARFLPIYVGFCAKSTSSIGWQSGFFISSASPETRNVTQTESKIAHPEGARNDAKKRPPMRAKRVSQRSSKNSPKRGPKGIQNDLRNAGVKIGVEIGMDFFIRGCGNLDGFFYCRNPMQFL